MSVSRSCAVPLLGLASSLALAVTASPSWAQLRVTGGGVVLNDVDVFVPTDGTIENSQTPNATDTRAVIYNSELDDGTLTIDTRRGNIPADAIFRLSTLPTISTAGDGSPATADNLPENFVGAQGEMLGTLSFRAIGPSGAQFVNVPTELQFEVLSPDMLMTGGDPFTEYRAENYILQETGFVTRASGVGVVRRRTPVTLVQYQEDPTEAVDSIVLNNFIPASEYEAERAGVSYEVDSVEFSFEDGNIFAPPGLFARGGSPNRDMDDDDFESDNFDDDDIVEVSNTVLVSRAFTSTTRVESISIFNNIAIINLPAFEDIEFDDDFGDDNDEFDNDDDNEDDDDGIVVNPNDGSSQFLPVLPTRFIAIGIFVFNNVPSGRWVDPPLADGFEYTMTPRDVPVGVGSRVFPGMTGVGEADDSVFTRVSGFPTGVDADDTFEVSVDGIVLGDFSPGDTLSFSDYADQLGDLLVDGGVTQFTVSEINPAVDSSNPVAFPLRVDFNTPTASFEMQALEAIAAEDVPQVSRIAE